MAAALARGLEAEGFVVDIAGDGPSGLEAARFGGYDAVLLDVMLPGASGYTVVKTLRAEQNWVPVIMLTAKDGEYDEADVSVSRREFLVLEHLLRAHPAVVSKESILDAVWGSPDETDANIVEVYIGYLRRKLGRARIETVRGVGYRMAP